MQKLAEYTPDPDKVNGNSTTTDSSLVLYHYFTTSTIHAVEPPQALRLDPILLLSRCQQCTTAALKLSDEAFYLGWRICDGIYRNSESV